MENVTPVEVGQSTSTRRRHVWKWMATIVIVCVLAVVVPLSRHFVYVLLGTLFPDSPPPDDRHLVFSTISVPKDNNAFFDLERVSSTLSGGQDEVTELRSAPVLDRERAHRVLARNVDAREDFRKASLRTEYLVPLYADPQNISSNTEYPMTIRFRMVASAVDLDARVLHESGDFDGAVDRAFELVRLGALMESSPRPSLIDYMAGTAIKRMGLDRLSAITRDPACAQGIRARVAREVVKYRDDSVNLREVFRFEYVIAKNILSEDWSDGDFRANNYLLRPNKTLGYFSDHFDFLISRIDTPCLVISSDEKNESSDGLLFRAWKVVEYVALPNGGGKLLFDTHHTNFDTLFSRRCEVEAIIDRLAKSED